jgi:hypothetical protein
MHRLNLADRAAEELGGFPDVAFRREGGAIVVDPASPEGFQVSLSSDGTRHLVHYEGWHEDFSDADQALGCFLSGLTTAVRLRVTRRGGRPCAWTVEVREGAGWKAAGAVGLLFFPFWRRKEVVTLQNRRIAGPPSGVQQS